MAKDKTISIVIPAEHVEEFRGILFNTERYVDAGRNVPYSLVNRLFELMWEGKNYKENTMWEQAKSQAQKAIVALGTSPAYQFKWKKKKVAEKGTFLKPDTFGVFTEMIYAFLLFKKDHEGKAGKNEAVAFFHSSFEDVYWDELEKGSQKKMTNYKQSVVAGRLAMTFAEFPFTPKPQVSNHAVFQVTRSIIKKRLPHLRGKAKLVVD